MRLPFMLAHQALELASAAHLAMQAIIGMARQQPFGVGLAKRAQGVRFCFDDITVFDHSRARWLRIGGAFDFNKTHAADGMSRQARIPAQCRNGHARRTRCVKHGQSSFTLSNTSIDGQRNHASLQKRYITLLSLRDCDSLRHARLIQARPLILNTKTPLQTGLQGRPRLSEACF